MIVKVKDNLKVGALLTSIGNTEEIVLCMSEFFGKKIKVRKLDKNWFEQADKRDPWRWHKSWLVFPRKNKRK